MARRRNRLVFSDSVPLGFLRVTVHDDDRRLADRVSAHCGGGGPGTGKSLGTAGARGGARIRAAHPRRRPLTHRSLPVPSAPPHHFQAGEPGLPRAAPGVFERQDALAEDPPQIVTIEHDRRPDEGPRPQGLAARAEGLISIPPTLRCSPGVPGQAGLDLQAVESPAQMAGTG